MSSNSFNLNISDESRDAYLSDLSDAEQNVTIQSARLEQETAVFQAPPNAEPTTRGLDNRAIPDGLPPEEWSKLSQSQKRSYLRKRKQMLASSKVSQTSKRDREGDSTPSPREDRKRPKLDYSAAVSSIRLAITHAEYPDRKLEEKSLQRLMLQLMVEIGKTRPAEGIVAFGGYTQRDGALVVNCRDQLSSNWLSACVARLSAWEGSPLKICDPKELEGYVRVSLFIPQPIISLEESLKYLQFQNLGLQTSRWRVLGHKEHDRGLFLVASIPESNYKVVEAGGMRLNHGLFQVSVKPLSQKEESAKPEEASKREDTDATASEVVAQEEEGVDVVAALPPGGTPPDPARRVAAEPKLQRPAGEGTGVPVGGGRAAASAPPRPAAAPGALPGKSLPKPRSDHTPQ